MFILEGALPLHYFTFLPSSEYNQKRIDHLEIMFHGIGIQQNTRLLTYPTIIYIYIYKYISHYYPIVYPPSMGA